MNDLINISICHSELDDFVFTKMPVVPRIGESIGFWAFPDTWCDATIIKITYEIDYKLNQDGANFTMVELYVTGGLEL
jgi:hypothetical protein